MKNSKTHWEEIYQTSTPSERSWTENQSAQSLDWILEFVPDHTKGVLDVGGGASVLVDQLLKNNYSRPAVLDLSEFALIETKNRLGVKAALVDWIIGDVTTFSAKRKFTLWHDRAVFHFLTSEDDRERYRSTLRQTIEPDAYVIIATFSPNGPSQCSGLDVMRFDEASLTAQFEQILSPVKFVRQSHSTPWGGSQEFLYGLFKAKPGS